MLAAAGEGDVFARELLATIAHGAIPYLPLRGPRAPTADGDYLARRADAGDDPGEHRRRAGIEQYVAARHRRGEDGALHVLDRVLRVNENEQPVVYPAAHGSALQPVGHELVKQGGEVVADAAHHVGKAAVRRETGYGVDLVAHQPPAGLEEHVHPCKAAAA